MVGNPKIIAALKKVKSYMDYGIFQPIPIAAISALNGPQECVGQINVISIDQGETGFVKDSQELDGPSKNQGEQCLSGERYPSSFKKLALWSFQNY